MKTSDLYVHERLRVLTDGADFEATVVSTQPQLTRVTLEAQGGFCYLRDHPVRSGDVQYGLIVWDEFCREELEWVDAVVDLLS